MPATMETKTTAKKGAKKTQNLFEFLEREQKPAGGGGLRQLPPTHPPAQVRAWTPGKQLGTELIKKKMTPQEQQAYEMQKFRDDLRKAEKAAEIKRVEDDRLQAERIARQAEEDKKRLAEMEEASAKAEAERKAYLEKMRLEREQKYQDRVTKHEQEVTAWHYIHKPERLKHEEAAKTDLQRSIEEVLSSGHWIAVMAKRRYGEDRRKVLRVFNKFGYESLIERVQFPQTDARERIKAARTLFNSCCIDWDGSQPLVLHSLSIRRCCGMWEDANPDNERMSKLEIDDLEHQSAGQLHLSFFNHPIEELFLHRPNSDEKKSFERPGPESFVEAHTPLAKFVIGWEQTKLLEIQRAEYARALEAERAQMALFGPNSFAPLVFVSMPPEDVSE